MLGEIFGADDDCVAALGAAGEQNERRALRKEELAACRNAFISVCQNRSSRETEAALEKAEEEIGGER